MDLAVIFTLDDAGIFEINEVFLLQRSQLVQHFVRRVKFIEAQNN
jgi:hypothetical protein